MRMLRRDFIFVVGALTAAPLPAVSQQIKKVAIVGIIDLSRSTTEEPFRLGLRDLGYIEGQNVVIIARYADGQQERIPGIINEMLGLGVDLFVSATTQAVQAIRRVNSTIPIVMNATSDPIGSGLVPSLTRPGNTTGLTLQSTDAAGKRLELLNDLIPRLSKVAVVALRNHPPTAALKRETQAAAQALRIELKIFEVEPNEFDSAFANMAQDRVDAVIIQQSVTFNPHMKRLAELALSRPLPTMHEIRAFVANGGLISYGTNTAAIGRRAASYVDRILRGTQPSDLPVEQPTKFDLIINLKAAKALGLNVPPTMLARADEVIE